MNKKEVWKVSPWFPKYEISNIGRVRNIKTELILKQHNHQGYNRCAVMKDNKRNVTVIHRLVANAFIPNPENKATVNHIDGNKSNNNVDNLEWSTSRENTQHAIKKGFINNRGDAASFSKLTSKDVDIIRRMYRRTKATQAELGVLFGVSQTAISKVINNVNWRK